VLAAFFGLNRRDVFHSPPNLDAAWMLAQSSILDCVVIGLDVDPFTPGDTTVAVHEVKPIRDHSSLKPSGLWKTLRSGFVAAS
jgi:hypothetical protein